MEEEDILEIMGLFYLSYHFYTYRHLGLSHLSLGTDFYILHAQKLRVYTLTEVLWYFAYIILCILNSTNIPSASTL